MFNNVYGIDFGSGSTKVCKRKTGIILNERSCIATIGRGEGEEAVAMGDEAYEMYEKSPDSLNVKFPIKDGAVAHLDDMVKMWDFLAVKLKDYGRVKGADFLLAVSASLSEVQKNAYKKVIERGKYRPGNVCLINMPVLDALGLELDENDQKGHMIINVGADTTEVSITAGEGIIVSKLIPYGGSHIDSIINNYIRKEKNFIIGTRSAERLKIDAVSAVGTLREASCMGRDLMTGLPREVTLKSDEIYPLLKGIFNEIAVQSLSILEHTPPEILSSIKSEGAYLTGASSWISGLDQFLADFMQCTVNTTKKAQKTVILGLSRLVEDQKLISKYALKLNV
ncbi:MAG: rod shape-determining protein [Lachnospiraceae bacterium]|jgi:rod shape-determining protein MreB|nr:rod shape-determining protein [Lachnospiraceae bacterium]MEE3461600.1 rod shape-determining protein [Lachnospiraceae bacterium]